MQRFMIRNTVLLMLLVFTFMNFAPVFMQPQEAEAADACEVCNAITDPVVSGAITQVFEVIKVSVLCVLGCKAIRDWKFNKCTAEGTKNCPGTEHNCNSPDPPEGCGDELICSCVFKEKHAKVKCENESCAEYNEYTHRVCKGSHTCSAPEETSSYSGSYW